MPPNERKGGQLGCAQNISPPVVASLVLRQKVAPTWAAFPWDAVGMGDGAYQRLARRAADQPGFPNSP